MMTTAWIIALALLVLYFSEWEEARYNPNQQPVTFLLDTGATDVVIPEKLAKKLGLRKGA